MRLSGPIQAASRALDRLRERLADPQRRERTILLALTAYVALWTLYGMLAKANQDLFPDMAEELVWARHLAFGFLKHPPLSPLLVKLWFSVVPRADWTFYLLAVTVVALALWIAWRLAGDFLDGDKRTLALVLLTLIPFFNFHALKYNVNSVLMPLWAATTLWFLRSYRTRKAGMAALAGIGAAAAILCKYWSVFLIAGLMLAALIDARRGAYFRSAAPWITVAAGVAVLSPHLIWLMQHDFAPVHYALYVHGDKSFATTLFDAAGYLAGAAGYVAVPVMLVMIAARPRLRLITDMVWPADPDRRLAAAAFWGPLLLPAAVAVAAGTAINSLWSMPAWALLPVLLLSPPALTVPAADTRRILGLAFAVPVVMVLAAPAVAIVIHRGGGLPVSAQSRLLSAQVERAWHAVTDKPLRYVDGNVAFSIAVYAQEMPRALPELPPVPAATLKRAGWAMACIVEDGKCMGEAAVLRRRWPDSRWSEVTIARMFFGIKGRAQRYAILIVPPQP